MSRPQRGSRSGGSQRAVLQMLSSIGCRIHYTYMKATQVIGTYLCFNLLSPLLLLQGKDSEADEALGADPSFDVGGVPLATVHEGREGAKRTAQVRGSNTRGVT